jgi:hypothetical protein
MTAYTHRQRRRAMLEFGMVYCMRRRYTLLRRESVIDYGIGAWNRWARRELEEEQPQPRTLVLGESWYRSEMMRVLL